MKSGDILGIALAALMLWGCIPQQTAVPGSGKKDVNAHYQMGVTYMSEGKSPQAIKELLEAQKLSSRNADIEHALGLAYQQKGLPEQAVEQYKKALDIDPKLTEARNNLGTAYLASGKLDEAAAEFEQCLKDKNYATPEKAAYNLGVVYFNKKDIDKAIEYYQKAVSLRDDNSNAYYNLGYCQEEKKALPKALEYYKKAASLDSSFKEAYYRMGVIYQEQQDYPKVLESLKKAVEIDPDYLAAHLLMGKTYLKVGNTEMARRKLDIVAKTDPGGELGKEALLTLNEMAPLKQAKSKGTGKQ
jgi:type IV pilus biogenesis/stability protein PilW